MGDPFLVSQIACNLFENAMKYKMEDRALQVRVSCENRGSMNEYRFSDNGIGIAPLEIPKVFQLFSRLHRKENVQGEGLGLAISRSMALKMNGDMRVESELGIGSTFVLTLSTVGILQKEE
jgi:signal transduction histidine kinase